MELVNQSLYKAAGKTEFANQELEEIILDTEINLNNRPQMYIDADVQFPLLTPNILIHGKRIKVPKEQFNDDD